MADKPAMEADPPADNAEESHEEPQHSTADYAQYPQAEKPIRNWTRIFSIFIIVLALASVGAGAYWYLKNHKSTPAKTVQTTQPVATSKISTTYKHYDSPNFYLGFDYPDDWTVSDSDGGEMTVISPNVSLKSTDGQDVSGKIVLTIRNKSQKLTEFDAGNAIAAKASVKVTYTKPKQTQRGSTYESFLRYASSADNGGLDGVYITGDTGYKLGQAIPAADFVPVDPIIGITFLDADAQPMTIAATSWDDSDFSGPLETLLESLSIT